MDFDNLVPLQDLDLIRMISAFQTNKSLLLLWQKNKQIQKRCLHKAVVTLINIDKGEMLFKPEGNGFNFLESELLYVFADERNALFKAKVKSCEPDKLTISIPKVIMISNSRKESRVTLIGQKIYLEFNHQSEFAKSSFHKSEIINISPGGLCFKAPFFNDFGFQKGDPIWMKMQNEEKLTKGEIRHLTVVRSPTHGNHIQIGVCF